MQQKQLEMQKELQDKVSQLMIELNISKHESVLITSEKNAALHQAETLRREIERLQAQLAASVSQLSAAQQSETLSKADQADLKMKLDVANGQLEYQLTVQKSLREKVGELEAQVKEGEAVRIQLLLPQ